VDGTGDDGSEREKTGFHEGERREEGRGKGTFSARTLAENLGASRFQTAHSFVVC